jgi:hypothetical protein
MGKINSSMEIKFAVRTIVESSVDALMVIDNLNKVVCGGRHDVLMPFLLELYRHEIVGHMIVMFWERCERRLENLVLVLMLSRLKRISDEEIKAIIRGRKFEWSELDQRLRIAEAGGFKPY